MPMMQNVITDPIAGLLGPKFVDINWVSILFRLGISFVLSAAIGCERANKRHSAGLRTFILVSLASTSAMLVDIFVSGIMGSNFAMISAATAIGIAIISTYSILYSSKSQIKGLTTAVGLWACCIIGLAVGSGFYTVALIGFFAVFCCLSLLPPLEVYLKDRSNHFEIHLELDDKRNIREFITTIRRLGLNIDDIEQNPAYVNSGLAVFSISLTITGAELKKYKKHSEIIEALASLDYVSHIEEIK